MRPDDSVLAYVLTLALPFAVAALVLGSFYFFPKLSVRRDRKHDDARSDVRLCARPAGHAGTRDRSRRNGLPGGSAAGGPPPHGGRRATLMPPIATYLLAAVLLISIAFNAV